MQNQRKLTKYALGPATTLGLLGGLVSGRGDDRLRTAARGAAKGFGTDLGVLAGGGLGLGLGMVTGAPILGAVGGGIGGGMLGHSLASEVVGPYETEEEKFERMLEAREAAQGKMKMKTAYEFGAKIAASACVPCHTPNGPTNKKPYTSASPAVTDASQPSEEIGKPPVNETEHSEAKAKQPEEGVKSAYEFGKKVAAINTGSGIPRYNAPNPEELLDSDVPPVGLPSGVMHPSPSFAARMERERQTGLKNKVGDPGQWLNLSPPLPGGSSAPTSTASSTWADNPPKPVRIGSIRETGEYTLPPTSRAGIMAAGQIRRNEEATAAAERNRGQHAWSHVNDRSGPPRPSGAAPVKPVPVVKPERPMAPHAWSHVNDRSGPPRPTAAPKPPVTQGGTGRKPTTVAEAQAAVNNVLGPVPAADLAAAEAAAKNNGNTGDQNKTDPAAAGGWGNLPAYAAGGLGAAGLAALLYHMANQPKKKRRDEEDA